MIPTLLFPLRSLGSATKQSLLNYLRRSYSQKTVLVAASAFDQRKYLSITPSSNIEDMDQTHSILNSSFPVFLPPDPALFLPEPEFEDFIKYLVEGPQQLETQALDQDESAKVEDAQAGSVAKRRASSEAISDRKQKSPFVEGLKKHTRHMRTVEDLHADNKTLTWNEDVTNISSKDPLVDLFYDLGEKTTGHKLEVLLENAWEEDALATLKIIFNARSIHLGKSNKIAAYKAFGWLADTHPLTFLLSLRWLVRPIIERKPVKTENERRKTNDKIQEEDKDFEMLEADENKMWTDDANKAYDIKRGMSHGYWKDLLNLLVLAANDSLKFDADPSSLLTQHPDNTSKGKRKREWDQAKAKELRRERMCTQYQRVLQKLEHDGFYRALHITVARLFADQLKEDIALLNSGRKADLKELSLAAKWAPTFGEFHDKHTFLLSSIAERLFPKVDEVCPGASNRELYLRHAREMFRNKYSSPLRKALSVVEREIAAKRYHEIKYERVPSLAMDRYTKLFIKKDYDHFADYVTKVAEGSKKISGATLLPSTLVSKARSIAQACRSQPITNIRDVKAMKASVEAKLSGQVIDGQWKTLVQRIRDSGKLDSTIAVCDVSGSMSSPIFKDKSCPMDSAMGLSLLLSEVTAPPFGGTIITFSEQPTIVSVGGGEDTRGLVEKIQYLAQSPWGYSTNFTAVFEDLILPMALSYKLKQEDMVKQVIVFSDMHFNHADNAPGRWSSAFDRIEEKYKDAGYEMPRLIFWNLADYSTVKPTTVESTETALVSGYSQGMLKTFLDGGGFEDTEEEEIVEHKIEGEDQMTEIKIKKKMDPFTVVKRAISHKAYSMLKVVD